MKVEFPTKMEIREPSGSKKFQSKYYFITFNAKNDLQVDVSVRSGKQLDPRELMQMEIKREIETRINFKKKIDPAEEYEATLKAISKAVTTDLDLQHKMLVKMCKSKQRQHQ